MKRFYFFALVAAMFAACATDTTEDVAIGVPETLRVSFEDEDSRIQLANGKTVWTKGDQVSVFYRSNANQKWQYKGETGERVGELQQVDAGSATREMDRVVVVYPYNESYYINPSTCNVQASLPAVQTYLADSYGLNGNIMISHGEYNNISLKSVCGWLKLQLTGNGEKVQTITLKGNNSEQVAGEIYINSADATAILSSGAGDADDSELGGAGGNLLFENTILNEVTLNCGEGVALGAEPTAFYIALPPQEFSKGLTIEVVCSDGSTMTKSTEKEVVIARNTIQPMAEFEYIETQPNNEIWYTATEKVEPNDNDEFGATIISNVWDSETGKGIITFNANVTKIGFLAFYECKKLKTIIIPDSVTSIGNCAFKDCSSLTSIAIPDSVTSIGDDAFRNCASLKAFYGKYATADNRCLIIDGVLNSFAPAGLTEYAIPDSVTEIGEWAFASCTSLTSVTIPDSVTEIGSYAFCCCTSLKAFYGKYASADNRCLIVNGVLNSFAPAGLTEYTIPDSVTEIGDSAFSGCTSLTSVTIPDRVTEIGDSAFRDCTSLKEVYCKPTTPPSGDAYMFSYNASGRKIYVPRSSVDAYRAAQYWNEYADNFVAYDFEKGEVVEIIPETWEIYYTATEKVEPDNYEFGATIISNVWDSESKRGIITFDGDVTMIGESAFDNCDKLTGVTLPEGVTSLSKRAFYDCDGLTEFTIPDSVTSIGTDAFRGCDSLTSVTIGNSVTSIGSSAFRSCISLTSITIPDSVTSIGDFAFSSCRSLTSITIPDSVTEIGVSVFSGCDSLTSVAIGDSVTSIGSGAFQSCDSLTSVTIGNSVTSIGSFAFERCSSLTSVTIGDSVTSIGNNAFQSCNSLTSITIPDSVTEIGSDAFSYCSSLTAFYGKFASADNRCLIIDGVLRFFARKGLTEYTIPDSVTSIGSSAFSSCTSLTSVTIPDGVTSIGSEAFGHCSSLTSVTIGNSVTSIGYQAFYVCSSLKEVYCKPTTPPSGESYMFSSNASGRKIYVPRASVDAYKAASRWSSYKSYIEPYDFE